MSIEATHQIDNNPPPHIYFNGTYPQDPSSSSCQFEVCQIWCDTSCYFNWADPLRSIVQFMSVEAWHIQIDINPSTHVISMGDPRSIVFHVNELDIQIDNNHACISMRLNPPRSIAQFMSIEATHQIDTIIHRLCYCGLNPPDPSSSSCQLRRATHIKLTIIHRPCYFNGACPPRSIV
jgi:hypothetical protein